jgi:spore maturation protein CgeB
VGVYGDYWNYFWPGKGTNRAISGPEMVKAFNASKIVLNVHADSDLDNKVNTRTFEATGCRSFLLTDRGYGMDEYFKIGQEVVCYDDERNLVELAKYYLSADKERKEISARGQERAYSNHTYTSRLSEMLRTIGV